MKKTYFGEQTTKALANFPFSYPRVHLQFIYALCEVKEAAALTHGQNGVFTSDVTQAIVKAASEIRNGNFVDQFPLTALQGGAGTSINMNVNEVIASLAQEILSKSKSTVHIHPIDHINLGQSTNDVNPTALKIACIRLTQELLKTVDSLISALAKKAYEFKDIKKLGRTHLQDAVPTTLGAEFNSYAYTVKRAKRRIEEIIPYFYEVNLGGTAIGNSINATKQYREKVYPHLQKITGLPMRAAENLMSPTSSQTDFVALSQALVAATLDISKIASDFRILGSGPKGAISEIRLPELQHGSSIMPGKVNPVLPEVINQLYFTVSGNNLSIEHCAQAAQLELGVMFPLLADRLLSSLIVSNEVITKFTFHCVSVIEVNKETCRKHLENSAAYATLLTPVLGYDAVTEVVKEAHKTGKTLREVILERKLLTESEFETKVSELDTPHA